MRNQYNQELDIAQFAFLGLGGGLALIGIQGVLGDGADRYPIMLTVGLLFLAGTWANNFRRVIDKRRVEDPRFPAEGADTGDYIVVWLSLTLVVGLGVGFTLDERWYIGMVIAGVGAAVLLALRLLFRSKLGTRVPEDYVLPAVALLGPVRMVFFPMGAYAVVRSLANYDDDGGNADSIAVLLVGIALLLLAFIEQGVITRRRTRTSTVVRPSDEFDQIIELLSTVKTRLESPPAPNPAPPPAVRQGKSVRPIWLVTAATAALLGLAAFVTWETLRGSDGAHEAPLVLAGLALILAVMGERLANLSLSFGKMTASITDGSAPAGNGPTPEGNTDEVPAQGSVPDPHAPAATMTPAPGDAADTAASLVVSPEGQTVQQTLEQLVAGGSATMLKLTGGDLMRLVEQPVVIAPAPASIPAPPLRQRTVTISGPPEKVTEIMDRLLS